MSINLNKNHVSRMGAVQILYQYNITNSVCTDLLKGDLFTTEILFASFRENKGAIIPMLDNILLDKYDNLDEVNKSILSIAVCEYLYNPLHAQLTEIRDDYVSISKKIGTHNLPKLLRYIFHNIETNV